MAAGTNSASVQRRIAQDADKLHQWPSTVAIGLDFAAKTTYEQAQLQRGYSDWTPIDLIELARACKMIALVDSEFERLLSEGVVIAGGKNGNTPVENPRGRAVATLNATISAALRRLNLSTLGKSEKRTQQNVDAVERTVRAKHSRASVTIPKDDSLLN